MCKALYREYKIDQVLTPKSLQSAIRELAKGSHRRRGGGNWPGHWGKMCSQPVDGGVGEEERKLN